MNVNEPSMANSTFHLACDRQWPRNMSINESRFSVISSVLIRNYEKCTRVSICWVIGLTINRHGGDCTEWNLVILFISAQSRGTNAWSLSQRILLRSCRSLLYQMLSQIETPVAADRGIPHGLVAQPLVDLYMVCCQGLSNRSIRVMAHGCISWSALTLYMNVTI